MHDPSGWLCVHKPNKKRGVFVADWYARDGREIFVALNSEGRLIAERHVEAGNREGYRAAIAELYDALDEYEGSLPLTPAQVAVWRIRRAVSGGDNPDLNGGFSFDTCALNVDVPVAGLVAGDVLIHSRYDDDPPPAAGTFSFRRLTRVEIAAIVEAGREAVDEGTARDCWGANPAWRHFRNISQPRYLNAKKPANVWVLCGPKDHPSIRFKASSDAAAVDALLSSLGGDDGQA